MELPPTTPPARHSPYRLLGFVLVGIIGVTFLIGLITALASGNRGDTRGSLSAAYSSPSCNVAVVELHGVLDTYQSDTDDHSTPTANSKSIVQAIERAMDDPAIKAIMLEVDSNGGQPLAAEEIATALERSAKPTVGLVRVAALSAAYWAISGTEHVIAGKNSQVGSIGVTFSYNDGVKKNEKEGFHFNEIHLGKFKDIGSADKPLTDEERTLFLGYAKVYYDNFIHDVASYRNLPVEQVTAMADGRAFIGEAAIKNGLIDAVGSFHEVREYLTKKIGRQAVFCESGSGAGSTID